MDIIYFMAMILFFTIFLKRDRYQGLCKKHGCRLEIDAGPEGGYQYCPKCENEVSKERL